MTVPAARAMMKDVLNTLRLELSMRNLFERTKGLLKLR